jgi:hypothetical protein
MVPEISMLTCRFLWTMTCKALLRLRRIWLYIAGRQAERFDCNSQRHQTFLQCHHPMLFHTKSETYSLIKLQLTAHAAPNPLDTDGVLLTYVQSIDYNSIFTLDKWLYLALLDNNNIKACCPKQVGVG